MSLNKFNRLSCIAGDVFEDLAPIGNVLFLGLHTQLSSLAVRKVGGKPGRVSHVMHATTDVTDSVIFTCYHLFQRCYRDQTNSK